MNIKNILNEISDFFDDTENPEEPGYDPVHVGAMIVLTIFSLSILFWLLWALLVFGGGIQAKALPFLKLIFAHKTAADFGYVGYPYEMGVFEGWPTNVAALVFCMIFIIAIWHVFKKKGQ